MSKLKLALIEPPVALRRGPARLTLAGATRSVAGAPVKVFATLTMLPPPRLSGPSLMVEFVSWIKGAVVVLESWLPC